jgi:hypothetical protein
MPPKTSTDEYSLTLTGPGHSFKRKVTEEVANHVINLVITGAASTTPPASPATPGTGSGTTPKQFIAQKRPENNYERVACLAYYLTHSRNTPHFKTTDITKLNTEAAGHISNPSLAVMHATATYHYLSAAGGGKKQLTSLGEAVVEALPDRATVKAAIAEHKPKRRRGRKRIKRK